MIAIRSTEKKGKTNTKGEADVLRIMHPTIWINDKTFVHKIMVESHFFIEKKVSKEIEGEEKEITERMIIQRNKPEPFYLTVDEINGLYSSIGTSIVTTDNYFDKQNENKLTILLAQTKSVEWQGMTEWIPDTEHEVVPAFTE